MSIIFTADEFFAKPNQLFKLLKVTDGNLNLGHRSANLEVITSCNVCTQQRESRANVGNFIKCLRCRTSYDVASDTHVNPTDAKELNLQSKNMLLPPKVIISEDDLEEEPTTTTTTIVPTKRSYKKKVPTVLLRVDSESEEESTTTTTTTVPTKRVYKKKVLTPIDSESDEEPLAPIKSKKSLKTFAKESLESIVCQAGEKTMKEFEGKKKERPAPRVKPGDGNNDIDESDLEEEDISQDLILKSKKRRPIDVSNSMIPTTDVVQPVITQESFTVVTMRPGTQFLFDPSKYIGKVLVVVEDF